MSAVRQFETSSRIQNPHQPRLPVAMGYLARVVSISDTGELRISDDEQSGAPPLVAAMAEGVLLQPQIGDRVLCIELDSQLVVTQVLQRDNASSPLRFSSHRPIEWQSPTLRLQATEELELLSAGRLTCYARDMVVGVARTLVNQARQLIQQAGDYSVTAKGLLRLNGKQQLITAEQDVRIDGKRINMG